MCVLFHAISTSNVTLYMRTLPVYTCTCRFGCCLLQSEHFPFLGVGGAGGGGQASALRDLRCRTTFYTALGRLLMVELGEDEEKFEQFMMPLTSQ